MAQLVYGFAQPPDELIRKARSGDADAQHELGLAYYAEEFAGPAWLSDYTNTILWLTKAAEQNHVAAQEELACIYDDKRDYQTAVYWFRKAAMGGSPTAMSSLGDNYLSGHGVTANIPEALGWYKKAAEGGDLLSYAILGSIYASGRYVAKDDKAAFAWFKKGADAGDANCQTRTALAYADGTGVERDDIRSYMWFKIAIASFSRENAKYGETPGPYGRKIQENEEYLKTLASRMAAPQITEGERLFREWKPLEY